MFMFKPKVTGLLPADQCPPGSEQPAADIAKPTDKHFIKGTPLHGPFLDGLESIIFGMGCFWCSEALFYEMDGVYSTQVGYCGGATKNPTYREVCSGTTNHNEVTRVVYDPKVPGLLAKLFNTFWTGHDPSTPFAQGNDCGTQYRSSIFYTTEEQKRLALASRDAYSKALEAAGRNAVSTEIEPAPEFYMGELDHQQYDAKPGTRQYCGLRPLGVPMPKGWEA